MTPEAANAFVAEVVEIYLRSKAAEGEDNEQPQITDSEKLALLMSSDEITFTTHFSETDIPDDTLALHRIHGTIFADYDSWYWYFSTKQFVEDIKLADDNPKIVSHFFHVNSGGGEAWFLDVAAEAVKNLQKPVLVFTESVMASAAYYLSCYADEIYAGTKFDTIGSIGTMVSFLDLIPMLEKYGAKYIEEYADQSSLKNKKYNDLRKGKSEQFKKEVLNPLAAEFIATVQTARPGINQKDERGVFKGQTFFTEESENLGLIDGRLSLDEAIVRAYELGVEYKEKKSTQKTAMNLITN